MATMHVNCTVYKFVKQGSLLMVDRAALLKHRSGFQSLHHHGILSIVMVMIMYFPMISGGVLIVTLVNLTMNSSNQGTALDYILIQNPIKKLSCKMNQQFSAIFRIPGKIYLNDILCVLLLLFRFSNDEPHYSLVRFLPVK